MGWGGGGCLSLPLPVRRSLSTTIPWWGTNLHCSSHPMHLGVHVPGSGAQGTSAGHRTLNIPEVGRGPLKDTGGRVRWQTQRLVLNTDHSERQSPDISPKYRRACSRQLGGRAATRTPPAGMGPAGSSPTSAPPSTPSVHSALTSLLFGAGRQTAGERT